VQASEGSPMGIPLGESLSLRQKAAQSGQLFLFLNSSFNMPFFTYILKSESHDTFYYGSTKDLDNRLKEHNAGKVRYTKGRRPWSISVKVIIWLLIHNFEIYNK
jgi:putative endonuclease